MNARDKYKKEQEIPKNFLSYLKNTNTKNINSKIRNSESTKMTQEVYEYILKPVGDICNLRCTYCYYYARTGPHCKMGNDELEIIVKETINCAPSKGKIHYTWHGGEPLLAGIDFFQKALSLQRKYKKPEQTVVNQIQTNGTLISPDIAQFFKMNNFKVGVSIDGPKNINRARKFESNRSSFERTLEGIKNLHKYNVSFGLISTISSCSVNYPEKIYEFFKQLQGKQFALKLNFVLTIDRNGNLLPFSVSPRQTCDFLIRLFDIWIRDNNPKIEIRPFKDIIYSFLDCKYRLCTFRNECAKYISFVKTSVYPCDFFPHNEEYLLGNLKKQSLKEILSSQKLETFVNKIEFKKRKCRSCNYWGICSGGCSFYRMHLPTYYIDEYCNARKRLFLHIGNFLTSTLRKL